MCVIGTMVFYHPVVVKKTTDKAGCLYSMVIIPHLSFCSSLFLIHCAFRGKNQSALHDKTWVEIDQPTECAMRLQNGGRKQQLLPLLPEQTKVKLIPKMVLEEITLTEGTFVHKTKFAQNPL